MDSNLVITVDLLTLSVVGVSLLGSSGLGLLVWKFISWLYKPLVLSKLGQKLLAIVEDESLEAKEEYVNSTALVFPGANGVSFSQFKVEEWAPKNLVVKLPSVKDQLVSEFLTPSDKKVLHNALNERYDAIKEAKRVAKEKEVHRILL